MEIIVSMLMLALGFFMLVKGADWFVEGASAIADRFGIPQLIIGLTIVAMGTSAPEAAVSITAALKGSADITIGNIVGSNILNILIILGISSIIVPLAVSRPVLRREMPFMTAVTVLLFWMGVDGKIGFLDGLVLSLIFLFYLGWLFFTARKSGEVDMAAVEKPSLWKSVLGTGAGLVLIIAGSHAAVDGASHMAEILGMSERFIGLTIVALGTSLPELVTSVSAAKKGNADIAIGNIVGSNIFNILFVVGISALITPVPFSVGFYIDIVTAVSACILLLCLCVQHQRLNRMGGIVLVSAYLIYFVMIC